MKPRCFVAHNQMRRDTHGGKDDEFKPAFDTTKAERYGNRIYVFDDLDHRLRGEEKIALAEKKMAGFTEKDFIVHCGDPALIGLCIMVAAAQTGGIVRLLVWNGRRMDYFPHVLASSQSKLQALKDSGEF
ncbi:hypothetical protein OAF54_02915 [bacterium]|nr:hypothetical protein [bacterium]